MKIVGHRGARGLAPENTLAGLSKGIEHHIDEIEFDLRVTSDDIVVLHHNPEVIDAAGSKLVIAEHTYEQLKAHKSDLATFREVIDTIDRSVVWHLEVKPGVKLEPINEQLRYALRQGVQAKNVRFASYDQTILLTLHQTFPDVQTVVIENWSGVRATRRARQLGTKRISMLEVWLWSGFIKSMAKRGYELYSFAPGNAKKEQRFTQLGLGGFSNNPLKAKQRVKQGLVGVITDYPDRFDHR